MELIFEKPNVLVLGGGGVLGEAWMMGLLSGLEAARALDVPACEHFVGTSAGAVVAAQLAAGRQLRRPDQRAKPSQAADLNQVASANGVQKRRIVKLRLGSAACAPLVVGLATRGGARVRAAVLRRLPEPNETLDYLYAHVAGLSSCFDGRLHITAVDRSTGHRVVFGTPGSPSTTVANAVIASCTVPWRFPPVTISGREYVDGAMWSPTNLDVAPVRAGTVVMCLNPTACLRGTSRAIEMLGRLSRSAAAVETRVLHRRGARVVMVVPNAASAAAMGVRLMDRARSAAVLSAGYQQGLALAGS